jgi:hypothetical protein
LIVWRFVDGKPGHENQSLGLIQALRERTKLEACDMPVNGGAGPWLDWLRARCRCPSNLPRADLLIGAGHATHVPMLACRRANGGRVVALMRPTLPLRWFDLCVVPEHDGVAPAPNVLQTRGVLNPIRPAGQKRSDTGLILVGGPSAHHDWDIERLVAQVEALTARDPRHWTLATSRRTPDDTLQALRRIDAANLVIVPVGDAAPGWLAGALAETPVAWVTEDSVSMLYEALTAQAACGVLPVPGKKAGRVQRGVDQLVADGLVTPFDRWRQGQGLAVAEEPFAEADRCAQWIVDTWLAD